MHHLFLGGLLASWHQLLDNYDFSTSFSDLCKNPHPIGCIPLLLSRAGSSQNCSKL